MLLCHSYTTPREEGSIYIWTFICEAVKLIQGLEYISCVEKLTRVEVVETGEEKALGKTLEQPSST